MSKEKDPEPETWSELLSHASRNGREWIVRFCEVFALAGAFMYAGIKSGNVALNLIAIVLGGVLGLYLADLWNLVLPLWVPKDLRRRWALPLMLLGIVIDLATLLGAGYLLISAVSALADSTQALPTK